jgi:flavodoxin
MTTRIAYFSWKGHTEKTATALAKLLNADLVRIEPARDIHVGMAAMKAFFKMKSPIRPAKTDLTGVDRLVIASPVWAGKVPPYVNAYLDSVEGGSGKPFHVLIEMGGRGDQSAIAVVRKALEGKGMKFVSSASTIEKDVEGGSFTGTLETFAAGIRE